VLPDDRSAPTDVTEKLAQDYLRRLGDGHVWKDGDGSTADLIIVRSGCRLRSATHGGSLLVKRICRTGKSSGWWNHIIAGDFAKRQSSS
jgi:hypothetical protein